MLKVQPDVNKPMAYVQNNIFIAKQELTIPNDLGLRSPVRT